ncbi:2-amino-4-hydroxy-6-hydroxymethyldihydropteridinepyrophosphokinase [Vibrio stylophorae]|uniref:2-amino-4-hydroxy-6-hydroxymethyldihydropteridine pyrophosphokinase n=1 Tax=Vibrio stylophorae TaxID=659351 RepID=A0ABM8ZQR4_9VIBR|nr:2-amino-4-hydroxy-6-hydroxymethyldihydropteridine diphosphokinase [Vibrio stylophorae]CAH0532636.1 2-amino-4-hydroxy-6-hydroxymethyldihydropteridinepyrophosphokinase [Vibrio stylophorae]
MAQVYIAIGSNQADPMAQARQAIQALASLPASRLLAVSSLYGSKPMGPQDQPDYINAVALIETALAPLALLDATQAIELSQGRVRKDERWGPRTLDLDILLYDQAIIESERLTVPHYGLTQREFVVYPLYELSPELRLPNGQAIAVLKQQLPANGLSVLAEV